MGFMGCVHVCRAEAEVGDGLPGEQGLEGCSRGVLYVAIIPSSVFLCLMIF